MAMTFISIVHGSFLERIKLPTVYFFNVFMIAIIDPFITAWTWGHGWLYEFGFKDFAGSGVISFCAGCCAIVGCLFLGPRLGRF
jgi:Amt family ammonium transporter